MPVNMNKVGIVVIGRNEAARIGECLKSLSEWREQTVYVDSGSIDASPEIAEQHGVHVIRLHQGPYSAARGRQVGTEELLRRRPNTRYIQFVDGDCVLESGWLEFGCEFLDKHPHAGVVVGQLHERRAGSSLLMRLVDVDWDLPIGEIDAIGGIAMMRRRALDSVIGWRIDLVAGEELDLSARLRNHGWQLHRVDHLMTLHEMGLSTLTQFWRRAVRSGFSYAQLAVLHGTTRCRRWLTRAMGNVIYGVVLPILMVVFLIRWPAGAMIIAAGYGLFIARVALMRLRRGDQIGFAFLYALVVLGCKVAGTIGTFKFLGDALRGQKTLLIEYKASEVI